MKGYLTEAILAHTPKIIIAIEEKNDVMGGATPLQVMVDGVFFSFQCTIW